MKLKLFILPFIFAGLVSCKKEKKQERIIADGVAAFIKSGQTGNSSLWYFEKNGYSFTNIIPFSIGSHLGNPAWSADRRKIYFVVHENQNADGGIYVSRSNGMDLRQLFTDSIPKNKIFHQLAVSHDNNTLVCSYEIFRGSRKVIELYKMCTCGKRFTRLTQFETLTNNAPGLYNTESYAGSFSADDRFLFFVQGTPVQDGANREANICKINMETNEVTLLRTLQTRDVSECVPNISPDGKKILFSNNMLLYIMDSDGANIATLGNVPGFKPAWNNGGNEFYFSVPRPVPGYSSGIYKSDISLQNINRISKAANGEFGGFSINY
jgi:Tol biopolymer transport system component